MPTEKKQKILFMDDEEMVKEIVQEMLLYFGYEVALASDGEEAIELYMQSMRSESPIDLVIMDLTIPGGMGGKDAIAKLLEIDPSAKVIVSSGYSNDPIMSNYKDYGFIGVIQKPFRIDELKDVISVTIA